MRRALSAILFVMFCTLWTAAAPPDEKLLTNVRATHKQLQSFLDAIGAYLTDYDAPPKAKDLDELASALQPTYIRELPRTDAWGTPFRYEADGNDYRVVSAGSDKKFDPSSWKTETRTADFTADAVVSNGKFVRAWDPDHGESAALENAAVSGEVKAQSAIMDRLPESERMPYLWKMVTVKDMEKIAGALAKYAKEKKRYPAAATIDELKTALFPDYIDEMRTTDGWGTPYRYSVSADGSSYTLVSAGSDKQFKPESWRSGGELASDAEDAVVRDGKSVRRWKMPS